MATSPQIERAAEPTAAFDLRVTDEKVRQAVQELVAAANPLQVIAFGSWARGEHGPESDLDLAVILDEHSIRSEKGELGSSIRVPMSIDVLEMTGQELMRGSLRLSSVHRDIVEDGVLVYEREGARPRGFSPLPTREDLLDVKVDEVRVMLRKARSDEQSLGLDGQSPQIAAFHGQQAIEKLLKAWLIALDVAPPKTHELKKLEDALLGLGNRVPAGAVTLKTFNDYAVKWRYADIPDPERIDLAAMRETVASLRVHVVRQILDLLPELKL